MSSYQSEAQLESSLVKRLHSLGWQAVEIANADALRANLKAQIETHNANSLSGTALSDLEFQRILNHLDKGSVFDKAETLRDKFALIRDDETTAYIEFFNTKEWCRNRYQVASQVTLHGKYENRYDVTLLVNGLPLVQIAQVGDIEAFAKVVLQTFG